MRGLDQLGGRLRLRLPASGLDRRRDVDDGGERERNGGVWGGMLAALFLIACGLTIWCKFCRSGRGCCAPSGATSADSHNRAITIRNSVRRYSKSIDPMDPEVGKRPAPVSSRPTKRASAVYLAMMGNAGERQAKAIASSREAMHAGEIKGLPSTHSGKAKVGRVGVRRKSAAKSRAHDTSNLYPGLIGSPPTSSKDLSRARAPRDGPSAALERARAGGPLGAGPSCAGAGQFGAGAGQFGAGMRARGPPPGRSVDWSGVESRNRLNSTSLNSTAAETRFERTMRMLSGKPPAQPSSRKKMGAVGGRETAAARERCNSRARRAEALGATPGAGSSMMSVGGSVGGCMIHPGGPLPLTRGAPSSRGGITPDSESGQGILHSAKL